MAFVNSPPNLANVRADDTMQPISYSQVYTIASMSPDITIARDTTILLDDEQLEAFIPTLYRYCLSLTATHWDAQDLMQNTLLKALTLRAEQWQRAESYRQAYLLRIARNLRIDEARRAVRLQQRLPLLHELIDAQHTHHTDQLEANMQVETAIKLLLDTLSPWQHAVYALRELLGYTANEAASLLDTTEGAIKSALRRARAALLQRHSSAEDDTCLPLPAREEQERLATYLAAFRNGNAAHLVQLILNQPADPAGLAPQIVSHLHADACEQTVQQHQQGDHPTAQLDAYNAGASVRGTFSITRCIAA
ncbi:RNA polymerase sigma factor [Paenibacillus campi]|uniref:RNA polymerase sigma factor n=1 Tax=Paenibacillus campi TaxID=3106031 RepID=UPI002AFFEF87|nr:RNA polymerase sigma factor [Paenibacillus sp. SGZ-1009]